MKLEIIDNLPFVVFGAGKKSCTLSPAEATANAHQRIIAANQLILGLVQTESALQSLIEHAVMNCADAEQYRAEQNAVRDEIRDHRADILHALGDIGTIAELVDTHTASIIRQNDEARLAATLGQFNVDHILKGNP
jgi:hypothetical protein